MIVTSEKLGLKRGLNQLYSHGGLLICTTIKVVYDYR